MIKIIICPVDFSEASRNAVEYAAKITQVFHGILKFINVERVLPVAAAVSLGPNMPEVKANARTAGLMLKDLSEETARSFRISSDYEVEVTTRSISSVVADQGNGETMIVMGTDGADNLFQFFFGTHTYQVIQKAECPVLMVPLDCSFGTYNRMVYAFSYDERKKLALKQFRDFAAPFNADIVFLHVSKKDTSISKDVFSAAKEEISQVFDGQGKISFRRIFSDDLVDAIDSYMNESPADILVMASHPRNVFENLFRKKPLLSGLSLASNYPILVFHA